MNTKREEKIEIHAITISDQKNNIKRNKRKSREKEEK